MDEIIDIDDLRKLKLPELKAMCKQNGIPPTGPKEVLIKRIAVSMGMDEEDEGVDEDALLEGEEDKEEEEEEEEEVEEEEEEVEEEEDADACISSSEDKEESVEPTESNETTSDSVVGGGEEGSTPLESPKKEEDPPIVDKDKENETGVSPSKKIKLIEAPPADPPKPVSELTDAERLKLRAEKYGVNTSKGALSSKEARAARFGTAADKKATSPAADAKVADAAAAAKVPKNVSAEDLEKMKQRGARFGATVSTTMSSVDNVDKILKRKERFGEVAATTTSATTGEAAAKEKRAARFGATKITAPTTASTTSSTEADELKKKRAERFKIPV